MSRKQPVNPNNGKPFPPKVEKQSGLSERTMKMGKVETRLSVQTRQYKLITPLFGGGVEPGVNDADNLIRATEIRGQLRFWWRAIHGGQFDGDRKKMKEREDEIWGAASNTNDNLKQETSVQITVDIIEKGTAIEPFEIKEGEKYGRKKFEAQLKNLMPDYGTFLGYIVFPLKPTQLELNRARKKEDIILKTIQKDIRFTLNLAFSKTWAEDIKATLWAWETFGGIGGRTRRGFGALLLEKVDGSDLEDKELPPVDVDEAKSWVKAKVLLYLGEPGKKQLANIPRIDIEIAKNMRILRSFAYPADAWKQLIDPLQKFRQRRLSLFGKNLWPEANALRRRLHPNMRGSDTPDKFPRAAFGLPIVFHMAHEQPTPKTITLQSTKDDGERWASRLILKPIPCRGKRFLGLALVLDGSELPGENLALMLEGKPWKTISTKQTQIRAGELSDLKDVLGNETDLLLAFLNYL